MRLALLALTLPLLAASAAGAVPFRADVAFRVPAQADGAIEAHATWLLAFVERGDLWTEGAGPLRLTNRTATYLADAEAGDLFEHHGLPHNTSSSSTLAGVRTGLSARSGAAALWLKARDVAVTLEGPARLGAAAARTSAPSLAGLGREAQHSARARSLGGATAYLAAADAQVRVEAAGVEAVEWFDFESACGCLPAGGRHGPRAGAGPVGAAVASFSYIELTGGLERVSFTGVASQVFVGGASLDVTVRGTARLPLASAGDACPRCLQTENRTLWAQGNVTLADLSVRGPETLGARFGGDVAATRLDERPVDPRLVAGLPAATVALGVVGGVAGSVLAFALFTRLTRATALDNANRRALYDAIVASPGIPFRELVRRTEVAAGTARYHLTVLVRAGLVAEKPHHNVLRFFENHGRFEANWAQVGLLREASLHRLHAWLQAAGPQPQKDILNALELEGWSRSTTQHRLRRLVRDGLATAEKQGRFKVYAARTPPAPAPGSFHSPSPMDSRVLPLPSKASQTSF